MHGFHCGEWKYEANNASFSLLPWLGQIDFSAMSQKFYKVLFFKSIANRDDANKIPSMEKTILYFPSSRFYLRPSNFYGRDSTAHLLDYW